MKRIAISIITIILTTCMVQGQVPGPRDSSITLDPVEIRAIRAGENTPFTKTNLNKKEIQKQNLGQDLPFLLNQTPSVVINSDAGNGVGYTGIRIRGSDATRINVTLNGIPYNDAESQGTFFVDLPDFASSVNSIQVQRGVGTSSNGAGAFGASINIGTNEINKNPYAEVNNSFGSFNTWKNTVKAGSGLLGGHFTTDLRLSRVSSDGFIDRASTDLKSFYFSTAYLQATSSLRLNIFSGKEKTYQAWNGVPENLLKTDRTYNSAGTEKPGTPYDNQTDNYNQDHFQLFFDHRFSSKLIFNTAIFLTKGKGYYEEYKADKAYADYNLPNPVYGRDTVFTTDLIRRLWLDNNFYGNIFSLQYKNKNSQLIFGGAYTRYDGNHFGNLVWASKGLTDLGKWYDLHALKTDFNTYIKWQQQLAPHWNSFVDLQYRHVKYNLDGFRDNPALLVKKDYNFFNPKLGINYNNNDWQGYISYSLGNKEPNRDDFEAGVHQQPGPERLHDFELGLEKRNASYKLAATLYYMQYKNQLVLTGQINDVGAYTRTNIPNSYRAGIELQGNTKIKRWLSLSANLAVSRNQVNDFSEYVDDYDSGGQQKFLYHSTDIAFSPAITAGAVITFLPVENFEFSLLSKYVGKQYLDNTQNDTRILNAYYTQDARAIYKITGGWLKEASIILQVNNVLNKKYEPNGYTYSYVYGRSLTTENYYFPMAGTNFMIGVNIRL